MKQNKKQLKRCLLIFMGVIGLSVPVSSLDTIEAFDPGLSDFEFYTSYSIEDKAFGMENVYGIGIVEGFSLLLALEMSFPIDKRGSLDGLSIGLIYTPMSLDVFEFDVLAGYTWMAPNVIPAHALLLGAEFNLYTEPMAFYLRCEYTPEAVSMFTDYEWAHPFALAPGLMYTLAEGMELFFEMPIEILKDHPTVFVPGIGFNFPAADWMEVLADFGIAVDTDGNDDYKFSIGTIMSI